MFTVDYKSRQPIYEQLYKDITRMAALGAMGPGEQLPSVRSLAQELGVNPNTVQKAYQLLERDGVICSAPGRGSFIAENSNALDQQKQLALRKLDDGVKAVRDCGLGREEIHKHVDDLLNGG